MLIIELLEGPVLQIIFTSGVEKKSFCDQRHVFPQTKQDVVTCFRPAGAS